jgi:thiol-disulfide isomerase/thioredoxin
MPADRRKVLAYALVGAGAAAAGAVLAPLVLQRRSGAAALLSTVFPDLQGQPRRLLDWKGSVTVTNFWATWCEPCREEMPLLADVRQRYRPKGVEVVGIGIDQVAKLVEFAANYKINYPLLVGDARALDVMRELGNRAGALPYTVILDRSGTLVGQRLGAFKPGELDRMLDPILL